LIMSVNEQIPVDETSDREIVISRLYRAPRELIWSAWTDPRRIVHWWGPTGFRTTIEVMDVRPGGVWKHVMHGPDGRDFPNQCVFIEVVRPKLIVYSHGGGRKGDPEAQFEATWTFVVEGDGTRVTNRMLFKSKEERNRVAEFYGAIEGGRQTLERLAGYLLTVNSSNRPTPNAS
jgi:uncharacterized protein YndB with AHSA1/START domain